MTTTKKLPVSAKPGKGHFLIPDLSASTGSGFIDIKTGKRTETGHLSYLGISISAEDILARYSEQNAVAADRETALHLLDSYLAALQEYKIGNVLSIAYSADGFRLVLEASQPPPIRSPRLP